MQLTVFSSDDNTYYLEISQDMPLGDLFALVAAEVRSGLPTRRSVLTERVRRPTQTPQTWSSCTMARR